jgi:hypothetical protein
MPRLARYFTAPPASNTANIGSIAAFTRTDLAALEKHYPRADWTPLVPSEKHRRAAVCTSVFDLSSTTEGYARDRPPIVSKRGLAQVVCDRRDRLTNGCVIQQQPSWYPPHCE